MPHDRSAAEFLPDRLSLKSMREAVQTCRGCDLYQKATQAVFGEGERRSRIIMVGEQPGDQEDLQGRPFVGPAGRILDRGLTDAGIDRSLVYVTNAVKHFKWEARGKRRIHSKPSARELNACRPWLQAELEVVRPTLLIALGATASQSLFGRQFRVMQERGKVFESEWAPQCMATVHPSSVLRAPDDESRRAAYASFLADLQVAANVISVH